MVCVICAEEKSLAKIDLKIEVDGNRPKGQRWVGALNGDHGPSL